MKGRVAVLKAYGGEFELREYPVPDPEPGAILIKLTRAGVCGSDLHIWRGEMKETYGALPQGPHLRPRDVRPEWSGWAPASPPIRWAGPCARATG